MKDFGFAILFIVWAAILILALVHAFWGAVLGSVFALAFIGIAYVEHE